MTEPAVAALPGPDEPLTVERLAEALHEPNRPLLAGLLAHLGPERCAAVLAEALTCEANGGMLTTDGTRRRTPGGVFIELVRRQLTVRQRRQLLPYQPLPKGSPRGRSAAKRPETPPPVAPTWEALNTAIRGLSDRPKGEAQTMKLTLIGRPTTVETQGQSVMFQLEGRPPDTLPKGLPPLPQGPALTWNVLVALRQWNRVKDALAADEQDRLIIEGYPLQRGKDLVVLAQSCVSIAQQRAKKTQQREAVQAATEPTA